MSTARKLPPTIYYRKGVPYCAFDKAPVIKTTCAICGQPMYASTVTWIRDNKGIDRKVKLTRIHRVHGGGCFLEWKKLSAYKRLRTYYREREL